MMHLANGKPPTAGKQNGGFVDTADREAPQHYREPGPAAQALQSIEGEAYATAYLARLRAHQAGPAELATLMQFLDGAMLQGACRVLAKALEGNHHA